MQLVCLGFQLCLGFNLKCGLGNVERRDVPTEGEAVGEEQVENINSDIGKVIGFKRTIFGCRFNDVMAKIGYKVAMVIHAGGVVSICSISTYTCYSIYKSRQAVGAKKSSTKHLKISLAINFIYLLKIIFTNILLLLNRIKLLLIITGFVFLLGYFAITL